MVYSSVGQLSGFVTKEGFPPYYFLSHCLVQFIILDSCLQGLQEAPTPGKRWSGGPFKPILEEDNNGYVLIET